MCSQTRAAALMANVPRADIDPSGVFKYVLIRVHSREEGDDSEIDIVRGYGWAEYHGESGAPEPEGSNRGFMARPAHSVDAV